MKVLIVGGNRFMGLGLTWRLLAAGCRVTHFNRGTLADPFADRVERLHGDRTRPPALAAALGKRHFDAVVDFAAFKGADAEGALAQFRGRVGHYILISTGQVYLVRESCSWPAAEQDYDGPLMAKPEDPLDLPEWEYGVGKRECEDVLQRAFEDDGFPATRLRIPMVDGEKDNLRRLEGYLWRILDTGPVIVPDGGQKPVRHVYAGAVVRQIADMLGRADTFGRAFNLSQDEMPTLPEFVLLLAELIGAKTRVVPVASDAIRAAGLDPRGASPFSVRWMSCLDPQLAKTDLGFRHEPLREYLGRIVASFLAHTPALPPPSYTKRREEIALAERSLAQSSR